MSAQPRGIVDRFPTPRRVTSDFGDDPSRRMALQVLYRALQELTPAPRPKAASERLTDYYARVGRLRNDGAFARAVLNKYGLTGLFADRGMRPGIAVRGSNAEGC